MTVWFETEVNQGSIPIPENLRDQLKDRSKVFVTVSAVNKNNEEPYDIIGELMKNPIRDPNFVPFTRDEIYDRHL